MSSPAVPAIPTARALSRVLAPLAERAFFDTHWERGPVHVGRDDPDHFGDLLTLADIERVLSSRELRFPDVQLTRSGTPVPVEDYADAASRILPRRLIARHHDGATVVLSRAHDLFPPLNDLVRELETALGWRCQTNVYLSPPGNRGFGSHYDSHDVFILQVGGRKTFRFYSGGPELPFTDERYDPEATGERVPGEVIELAAGDTLYIPRGVLHDAVAHAGAPSLHVTLGVFPVVLRDVLRELVQVAAEREPALAPLGTARAVVGRGGRPRRARGEPSRRAVECPRRRDARRRLRRGADATSRRGVARRNTPIARDLCRAPSPILCPARGWSSGATCAPRSSGGERRSGCACRAR